VRLQAGVGEGGQREGSRAEVSPCLSIQLHGKFAHIQYTNGFKSV
jgi:hypothetical protein